MHLFGGTAMINIPGALYSFILSIISFIFLSIMGYYGLLIQTSKVKNFSSKKVNSKFRIYKFLVFSEVLAYTFYPPLSNCANRNL